MARYAVGDLQGCLDELLQLLALLDFDFSRDRLWIAGDLVNRGPQSLEVLRWIHAHRAHIDCVLGNHDIHLLAVDAGHGRLKQGDTLEPILAADDRDQLIDWLASLPLAHHDGGWLMLHAGLAPQWSVDEALSLADEASRVLADRDRRQAALAHLYGDQPDRWAPTLRGEDRLRCIVNAFTRLRFCSVDGRMAMKAKGTPGSQPEGLLPWFAVPGRRSAGQPIVFGHWSTLGQVHWPEHHVHGLDTGCVWGGRLTALNLDSGALTALPCPGHLQPGND